MARDTEQQDPDVAELRLESMKLIAQAEVLTSRLDDHVNWMKSLMHDDDEEKPSA